MIRSRTAAALGTLALVAPAGAAAASHVSHAKFWQNRDSTAVCGIEIHQAGKPATEVICSAQGLPTPKHGVGDPFVQIAAKGKPQVVLRSQDSFEGSFPATLKPGTTWRSLGVTCAVKAKTVRCVNKSGHGFKIGNGKYHHF